jgi:quinol monooxygenase YgiN
MSIVVKFIQFRLKQGCRDEFLAAMEPLCVHVDTLEPGTPIYLLHTDREDPDSVWAYAHFVDEVAWKTHCESSAYRVAMRRAEPMIESVSDPEIEVLAMKWLVPEPVARHGVGQ